jgi:APA family basic amino acid/polyamine antiporter
MSRDGLVPPVFSDLHPKNRTPFKSQWTFFIFVSLFAAFIPDNVVGDMTSIGTLFAFVLVSIGILIIRKKKMANAPFKTPAVWIVAPLGALVCLAMIAGLGWENWARLFVWLMIGFVIYFGYGRRNSKVQHDRVVKTTDNLDSY